MYNYKVGDRVKVGESVTDVEIEVYVEREREGERGGERER